MPRNACTPERCGWHGSTHMYRWKGRSAPAAAEALSGHGPPPARGAQLTAQLDVPGPESRLFSAPLSAPGAAASFDPLPAGLFAASGADPAGAVHTQFLSLTFNPFAAPGAASAPSLTRLKFGDGSGGEIPVHGLQAPVRFTMPASTVSNGTKAACTFWNDTAGAFSSAGCGSLPNPAPPNHTTTWLPLDFNYSAAAANASVQPPTPLPAGSRAPPPPSAAALATAAGSCTARYDGVGSTGLAPLAELLQASFQVTGPLMCGCNATLLSCADDAAAVAEAAASGTMLAPRRVFLSPRDALLIPAITCSNGSSAVMLIFYGESCKVLAAPAVPAMHAPSGGRLPCACSTTLSDEPARPPAARRCGRRATHSTAPGTSPRRRSKGPAVWRRIHPPVRACISRTSAVRSSQRCRWLTARRYWA